MHDCAHHRQIQVRHADLADHGRLHAAPRRHGIVLPPGSDRRLLGLCCSKQICNRPCSIGFHRTGHGKVVLGPLLSSVICHLSSLICHLSFERWDNSGSSEFPGQRGIATMYEIRGYRASIYTRRTKRRHLAVHRLRGLVPSMTTDAAFPHRLPDKTAVSARQDSTNDH